MDPNVSNLSRSSGNKGSGSQLREPTGCARENAEALEMLGM